MFTTNIGNLLQKLRQLGDVHRDPARLTAQSGHRDGTESVCRNVKRSQNTAMALRWIAAAYWRQPRDSVEESLQALAGSQSCACGSSIQNASANELKTPLMSHSIIHGDAYFAYFNKTPKETM